MKKYLLLFIAIAGVTLSANAQIDLNVKYRGEVNVGFATGGTLHMELEDFNTNVSRPFFETIHGVTITKYAFIGGGIGLQYYYGPIIKNFPDDKWKALTFPLFISAKGMYPVNDNFAPFISLNLGGSIVATSEFNKLKNVMTDEGIRVNNTKLKGGFYCDFGAGIQYKKFNIGIGLQHQVFALNMNTDLYSGTNIRGEMKFTSFYAKLGLTF